MARPRKKGLDYFPLDVDIFEDEKFFDLQNEYGPLGEVIYMRLLCLVYKNGYYYRFESIDKLAAMMIRSVGNRWARDKKTVKEVISYLAKINLFSAELMQRNILTSRGIQERYLAATERRQSKIEEYNLLEKNFFREGFESVPENQVSATETRDNVTETSINVSNNAPKESKEKESKAEESKEKKSTALPTFRDCLSITEYLTLSADYGEEEIDRYCEKIMNWQEKSGKQVSNAYELIKKWIVQDDVPKQSDISKYEEFVNRF